MYVTLHDKRMENIISTYFKKKKKKEHIERTSKELSKEGRKQNEIVNGRSMTTETFLNNSKQKNNKRTQLPKDQKQ